MPGTVIDLSHHNDEPNWAALKAGGVLAVILKATEGATYADPMFTAWRARAHAAGLAVGIYHFARLGPAAAEAAWLAATVARLQPGEFIALDLEVSVAGVDPVAWTGQFVDALARAGDPVRLLYINKSFLAGHDWAPIVARGLLLWLADYDHSPAAVPSGQWPSLTLKQYTDTGTVPGETGTVDVDVLLGALTDLTGGTDMPLTDADVAKILDWGVRTPDGGIRTLSQLIAAGPALLLDAPVQKVDGNGKPIAGSTSSLRAFLAWDDPKTIATRDTITAAVDALAQQVAALQQAVAALPAQTAQALPAMACQGNPKAVLGALGQAASAAASST